MKQFSLFQGILVVDLVIHLNLQTETMPSVDEDNVVEKGELEATKVSYTFCQDNIHQKKGLNIRVTPEKSGGRERGGRSQGGRREGCLQLLQNRSGGGLYTGMSDN